MAQLYLGIACLLGTAMFGFGDSQGVGGVRVDTQHEGDTFVSCGSGQAEAILEQVNAHLQNFTDRIEGMLQEMESSIETKMTSSLENIQSTVDKLCKKPPEPNVTCPEDFVYHDGINICFKFYLEKLSRADASGFCRDLQPSSRLAVLDTDDKLQLVRDHMPPGVTEKKWKDLFWLGGRQYGDEREGRWLWSNGRKVTTCNWGKGQPDDAHDGEDCLTLSYGPGFSGWLLNDAPCADPIWTFFYICEFPMDS